MRRRFHLSLFHYSFFFFTNFSSHKHTENTFFLLIDVHLNTCFMIIFCVSLLFEHFILENFQRHSLRAFNIKRMFLWTMILNARRESKKAEMNVKKKFIKNALSTFYSYICFYASSQLVVTTRRRISLEKLEKSIFCK